MLSIAVTLAADPRGGAAESAPMRADDPTSRPSSASAARCSSGLGPLRRRRAARIRCGRSSPSTCSAAAIFVLFGVDRAPRRGRRLGRRSGAAGAGHHRHRGVRSAPPRSRSRCCCGCSRTTGRATSRPTRGRTAERTRDAERVPTPPDGYLLVLARDGAGRRRARGVRARRPARASAIALLALPAGLGVAIAIAVGAHAAAMHLVYAARAWSPPLGVALRADGARGGDARRDRGGRDRRGRALRARTSSARRRASARRARRSSFWTLLLAVWAGLNAGVRRRRPLQPLRRARAARPSPRCRWSASTAAPRRCRRRCATCCSRCSARCSICSASALLYGAYGTLDIACLASASGPRPADVGGGGADDGRAARQDGAVPAAPLAAAGPCRRAGGGQRRAVGAGGEGVVLPDRAAVVRASARRCRTPAARQLLGGARRRGDPARRRAGAAPGAAEAAHRLLDGRRRSAISS